MAEWWSIEILDHADLTANQWREARGSALIEAAISNGVQDWEWHRTHWGVVFEVAFADWDSWRAYRELPAVIAALDAAPDPINGVAIYPGRGGNAGSRVPRRPGPVRGAGAAAIPQTPEPAWAGPALIERVLVGVA